MSALLSDGPCPLCAGGDAAYDCWGFGDEDYEDEGRNLVWFGIDGADWICREHAKQLKAALGPLKGVDRA